VKKRLKDDEQRFVDTVAEMAAAGETLTAAAVARRARVNPRRLRMFARRHHAAIVFDDVVPEPVEVAPAAVKVLPALWKPELAQADAPQLKSQPPAEMPKAAPPQPQEGAPVDGDVQGQ
jgi:hypothetical protein